MSLPDARPVVFDENKMNYLRQKIDTELFPTLNQKNNYDFNLENILCWVNFFC